MNDCLKISIVTACYNQQSTIERTIRSVVGQGYPNLEYVVVDGCSADSTLEIVQGFGNAISRVISEPDDGQYHAIQKGMTVATGDVMAWLNGDDLYLPWTFRLVNEIFKRFPEVEWITGLPSFADDDDVVYRIAGQLATYPRKWIANGWFSENLGGFLQQESMFWRRGLWERSGGLDLSLGLAADFELWTKFANLTDLVSVSVPLAAFRTLPGVQRSSVMRQKYNEEVERVASQLRKPPLLWNSVAKRGLVARSIWRALMMRRGRCVVYDRRSREWKLLSVILPVSRASWNDLRVEFALGRGSKTRIAAGNQ